MKQKTRMSFMLMLLALCIGTVVLMHPTSTQAASLSTTHMWAKGHAQPNVAPGNLLYNGGPVMAGTTKVYVIFWEPKGSFVSRTYNKLILRYFNDVGNTRLYENNEQYTDSSGKAPQNSVLAASWVDKAPYPTSPDLADADVQNEVTHAMAVNGWKPAITHVFFVFTALGELICDSTGCSAPGSGGFCAYHSAFNTPGGAYALYGAMPYAGNDLQDCYTVSNSPNHDADADAMINATSHEQMEAATDPLPGIATAWQDASGGIGEIGDKCAYQFGPLNKLNGDVIWNGHPYMVQKEWDNQINGCTLKGP